jgi:hypothetical protein
MAEAKNFKKWHVTEADLQQINLVKAKNLIIECFYQEQSQTFRRVLEGAGVSASENDVRKAVVAAVKFTFKEIGEDYDNPTKESLIKVVELLAKKAAMWGTPLDIIEHNIAQLMKVIKLL